MKIIIPIAPRTKKNSMMIVINPKTKRPFLMPSKLYRDYEKECGRYIQKMDNPIDYPVNVKCVYYMPTKRKVDLTNLMEASHDMLVHYGVLSDDNSNIIVSVDGSRVYYDKENPRCEIEIEKKDE